MLSSSQSLGLRQASRPANGFLRPCCRPRVVTPSLRPPAQPELRVSTRTHAFGDKKPVKENKPEAVMSTLVAEETVYLIFQLDLDIQLQRSLNTEAYDKAQEIRAKRHKVDEAIQDMMERKASKMGTGSSGALATLSVSDFASEGLRLRTEMQRAVEDERYKDAASFKELLAELDRESKKVQALAEEFNKGEPKLRLGMRVTHKTAGYRGVIVGWDLQCCESEEWIEAAGVQGATSQPFYHVVVDERDMDGDAKTDMPPTAYVPEDALTAPELEPEGRAWVEVHGKDQLQHPFLSALFLGADGRGDYLPCRHLRNKYNVQRKDVYKPGEEPGRQQAGGAESGPQRGSA